MPTPSVERRRKRARLPADKQARREAILQAAERLLVRDPAATFSVQQLAQNARPAKGTVYLYFRTREEVLLALHQRRAHELFDVLGRALAAPRVSGTTVVAAGLAYLRTHPDFYPLAANCRSMLDTNIAIDTALAFKQSIAARLKPLGQRIEEQYPGLARGEGAALLLNSYALIIGLWQQADTPLSLRPLRDRPELAVLRIDFEKQLKRALLDLWDSAGRRAMGGGS
jgi:AcrR family transcriptional regulator